jgi:two-component system KDP operon response regulator KdpE
MILDLGLPDMDGVDVAAEVRKEHNLPIIVLSARGDEQQQIRALDTGANDYITKPFREGELLARIRAALRHAVKSPERPEITVGAIRIDPIEREVYVRGVEVRLTPTEFKLVHLLARESDRVVTHRRILREVWGPDQVDQIHYLRVYMKQLRQKLEEDPSQPKLILTSPGVGYRLVSGTDTAESTH